MRIRGHERHGLVNLLRDDIAEGRTVCLVADRDLTGRGVPIVWQTPDGPVPATMPAGPALLAATTGAALVGVCCHYDSTTTMHIDLSDPLDLGPRPLRDQVRRTTQQLADWFAPHIRRHVVDWHMMQPQWIADGRDGLPGNNNYKVFEAGAKAIGYKDVSTGHMAINSAAPMNNFLPGKFKRATA